MTSFGSHEKMARPSRSIRCGWEIEKAPTKSFSLLSTSSIGKPILSAARRRSGSTTPQLLNGFSYKREGFLSVIWKIACCPKCLKSSNKDIYPPPRNSTDGFFSGKSRKETSLPSDGYKKGVPSRGDIQEKIALYCIPTLTGIQQRWKELALTNKRKRVDRTVLKILSCKEGVSF
jgi:hypothetical protein